MYDYLANKIIIMTLILQHTYGKACGRKNVAPKLKRGHCTARNAVLAAPPAMVKDKEWTMRLDCSRTKSN